MRFLIRNVISAKFKNEDKTSFNLNDHSIWTCIKFDVEGSEVLSKKFLRTLSETDFQKSKYDAIYIIESNTTNSYFLNIIQNDYDKINELTIKPKDAKSLRDSCYVSHRDRLYLYGGSNHSNIIFNFDCDNSEINTRIKFNFVGGTCASNDNYILMCFPAENRRLCYKSNSPVPKKWWQWFTYVELAYASHDSIALSSSNTIQSRARNFSSKNPKKVGKLWGSY